MADTATLKGVEITKEKLQEVTEELKTFVSDWPEKIASRISKDKVWKDWSNNKCTAINIRSISNGVIKSQMHRMLFVKYASELLEEAIAPLQEAQVRFSQVKQAINENVETPSASETQP
jgi:molecular chaperone DnaK (HSP70)